MTADLPDFVVGYGHFVVAVSPQQRFASTITRVMSIYSVDSVSTIQCSMQLTAARFRHQLRLK